MYIICIQRICSLLLDASKAFDIANYCKFAELLQRNISLVLLRLLIYSIHAAKDY